MDANTVKTMTESLMAEHGLIEKGWRYKPSKAKTYAGQCRYGPKVIAISTVWAEHMSDSEVKNTMLHEIAHAVAGNKANHSMTWKRLHISMGGDGEVRFSASKELVAAVYNRTTSQTTPARRTPTVSTYAQKFDRGFTSFDDMFNE